MPPKRSELTPAEWSIMRVVWEKKEVVVRDVFEALSAKEGWAQPTVRTMMERLVKKGLLRHKKIGPVYLYKPGVSHDRALMHSFRAMAARVTEGNLASLFNHAVESGEISDKELAELEDLIRKRKEGTQ
ncbi:BlaI/MecI/CopY family transcriptional regulator [bacterium]|nr:BlaI/MecI/CopY family transcriptional regulator [bacterium]